MSSTSSDSGGGPPPKRAKKSGSEDDEEGRLSKADREYLKILDTFEGFYLNRWSKAAASYIEPIARCTSSDRTVVKAAAEFAVASLNAKKNNNKIEDDPRLIRVLRSNYLMCGRFYITLEASDGNFYEARVVLSDLDNEEDEEEEEEEEAIIGIHVFKDDDYVKYFVPEVILGEKDDDGDVELKIDEDDDDEAILGEKDDYGDVELKIDEDDDEDDDGERPDHFGIFIECYYFKMEMMRIALHYPKLNKTYGPRCTS